jgi:excisionase family DNA binding protein
MRNRKRHTAPANGIPLVEGPKDIYTIPEVAQRWRCHRHTVTAAIRDGRLQAFKVGERTYRIRGAEVARYEREHMMKAAS